MNANVYVIEDYENETYLPTPKNKPNSNPNKPNFRKNECKLLCGASRLAGDG